MCTSVPQAVTDLKAENVTTTTITLTWRQRDDHKPSYSYQVEARQEHGVVYSNSTTDANHTVSGLTPGEIYWLDVLTVVGGVSSSKTSIINQTCKLMKNAFKVEYIVAKYNEEI